MRATRLNPDFEILMVDFEELAEAQARCKCIKSLREKLHNDHINVPGTDKMLLVDISNTVRRAIVLSVLRRNIFDKVHGLTHVNKDQTACEAVKCSWWPHI